MKEIRVGKKIYSIRATPLALFYYHQEFGRCMADDFLKILYRNQAKGTDTTLMKMIWAMRKSAEGVGKPFCSFEVWVKEFTEEMLLENSDNLASVIEEAMNGLLTSNQTDNNVGGIAEDNNSRGQKAARLDMELIAIGKEIGFSLQEINEFTVQDLFDYVDAKVNIKDKGKKAGVRSANQDDIDMFLS